MSIPIATWNGCYDGNWRGLIVPEAFRHPAKFAPWLVKRILLEGWVNGWWKPGDLIGDPFGGIGGGGIVATPLGYRWLGVELEERFVALAHDNFAFNAAWWAQCGFPMPQIVQGDSRAFASIVGKLAGIVTSPAYGDQVALRSGGADTPHPDGATRKRAGDSQSYGATPGQIGELRYGTVDAVVMSPPYGGNRSLEKNAGTIDFAKNYETYRANGGGSSRESYARTQERHSGNYGDSPGQIGETDSGTYWQAMATVYGECRDALKPGGVMAVVVKDYVRARQVVPLCNDTLRLLETLGFEPLLRARAMLVKERKELTLAGEVTTRTERKSFFRRLAEKKGSPRIDWEEVLFVRRSA